MVVMLETALAGLPNVDATKEPQPHARKLEDAVLQSRSILTDRRANVCRLRTSSVANTEHWAANVCESLTTSCSGALENYINIAEYNA